MIAGASLAIAAALYMSTPSRVLEPVGFADLAGWAADDHASALAAFRRSCREILSEGAAFARDVRYGGSRDDWVQVCKDADSAKNPGTFFETSFLPFRVVDPERPQGLFTGYFEPEAKGSLEPSPAYPAPIYARPPDLVAFSEAEQKRSGVAYGRHADGKPVPYFSRKEIESGALAGQGLELVWLKDWADAFFIHVQGSGRILLPDGKTLRLAYAAKSGRPYTGIGGRLVERGVFTREEMSMQATRAWMKANPQQARELMWENESFIFFRKVDLEDPSLGAYGAQHVQLTPQRSLAVDRSLWMFGTPVWLETQAPTGSNASLETFRRLMIAQDTGTAITGHARGDVYWGFGDKAAIPAGHMKSPGTMYVLLPKAVAASLGLVR